MYKGKRILGLIPARGGSKGIPRKNIINLCGKPLINYTIEAGKNSKYIDYLIVSTDDLEIADIARQAGADVPFIRPSELATDTAKTVDTVIHAINFLKTKELYFDTMVLLQPTQPLRDSNDIDLAIELYSKNSFISLASVSPVSDHPLLIRSIDSNRLHPLLSANSTCRRQDMPKYYRVNGCIYINNVFEINENTSFNDNPLPYIMETSHSVDIDDEIDLVMAEFYINKHIEFK